MKAFKAQTYHLVVLGIFCFLSIVERDYHGAQAARLAATRAARDEAAQKLDKLKSPEELQKAKEKMAKLKEDIQTLLLESKEYKQATIKKSQEQEVAEFTPEELEETDLWKKEYDRFMKAEKQKEWWERLSMMSGVSAAVAGGLTGFGKAHENAGGVAHNPSAARLVRGAGTVALVGGALALFSWLMRRHNKKRQKLSNARLARMQFEARTGLKPSDENVLGPDESDIFKPKGKKDKRREED
ncbi:hypothetical protein, conserved [Eimeria tenella]|uniref:Transmembrane protein n=1 Tax=Eimeria tenella TaxID=5802 RepID=H9B9V5_EIMTE|nr:hypothetical protein, conserved [Eimeria tenella]AET50765.1 hypothetical protein [Eimeria tenella]CDJ41253.1 hypothetical protein, conserved [Eimeria tenella]|eukprot:XP_013232003.1 hypothetical protein, conserved [Eimeria tenella]